MCKLIAMCLMVAGVVAMPLQAQSSTPKKGGKEAGQPEAPKKDKPAAEKKKLSNDDVKKQLKDKKTSVAFEELELKDALAILAKAAELEFKLAEGVAGDDPVSVSMKNASIGAILKVLLEFVDLTWEAKDGGVLIKKADSK